MTYSTHQELATLDGTEYRINPPVADGVIVCPKKYKLHNIQDMCMASDISHPSLQELIEIFHYSENEQPQLDSNYQSFCDLVFQEMDTYKDECLTETHAYTVYDSG